MTRKTIHGRTHIVRVSGSNSGFLSFCAKYILSVQLRIVYHLIPQSCYTGIVRSGAFCIVSFQTPDINRLGALGKRVQAINDYIA